MILSDKPKIELLNADCMDVMKTFSDKQFDLAIVDPPYGLDANSHRENERRSNCAKSKRYHNAVWEQSKPTKEYFLELKRISINQIIWGANHFISQVPFDSSCWIVWDKLNGDNDFADCELAYTSFGTSVRKFSFRWQGMLQGNMKDKEQRIHPTQKPVKLYTWLLQNYVDCGLPIPNILDTHAGSLSIGIACHRMGFNLLAIEKDKDYYEASIKRFKQVTAQTRIF